jgi:hypothetical protein
MSPLYARIPVRLHDQLRRLADQDRRSVSAQLEVLLEESLTAQQNDPAALERPGP